MQTVIVEGEPLYFPASMTDTEIADAIDYEFGFRDTPQVGGEVPAAPEAGEPSYLKRLSESVNVSEGQLADTMASLRGLDASEQAISGIPGPRPLYDPQNTTARNLMGSAEGLVQTAGAVAGVPIGMAGETAATALDAAGEMVPEGVKDYASGLLDQLLETSVGKWGMKQLEKAGKLTQDFKKKYPQEAKTLMAAFESGTLLAPVKKLQGPADKMGAAGTRMVEAGEQQTARRLSENLLAPPHKVGAGDTVEKGLTRRRAYEATPYEMEMAKETATVPGINYNRSAAYNNMQVVKDARNRKKDLDRAILKEGNPEIDKDKVMDDLGGTVDSFDKSDASLTLSGDASKYAKDILWKAYELIDESDGTTLGLLDARRQLDRWIDSHPSKGYDPQIINGRNVAQKLIRDQINDVVDTTVPNAKVRESLRQQHLLLTAHDRLKDKIAAEGENVFGRLLSNISSASHVGPVGALTTATMLGGSSLFAGLPTGTAALVGGSGGTLYALMKGWNSPTRKKFLGNAIRETSKAINSGVGNAQELKLDRMVLIDMLRAEAAETEEDNG
jgi:hypothetical protein